MFPLQSKRRSARGLGAPIPRTKFVGIATCVFIALLIAWITATGLDVVRPIFLPSPANVVRQLLVLSQNGTLWVDLSASVYRILAGFLLATLFAMPIGLIIGAFPVWEAAIEPLVDFIRYMPVVAFVPLSILWIGTGDLQKFVIIFIGTFFQQVLMIMDEIKRVPKDYVALGRTLNLSDLRILTTILMPNALPAIWDILRISLGWAWTWLVVAELVAATEGLGYRIVLAQRYFQTNTIFAYILLLGFLGLATDQIMKAATKRLFPYLARGR